MEEEEEEMEGRRDLARTESGSSSSASSYGSAAGECESLDYAGSDRYFATECEEIPERQWMTPSLRSYRPPPRSGSSSEEKTGPVKAEAGGEWLAAVTRGWGRGWWGERRRKGKLLSAQKVDVGGPTIFSFQVLKKATEKFSDRNILGKGRSGTVYKGILPTSEAVAIKKIRLVDRSKQFTGNLLLLSQVAHRNVVRLLGCCLESEFPLLVYEFVPNGTLYDHIQNAKHTSELSWETRLRIARETAAALAYLQSATPIRNFHGDVRSSNILLEWDYTVKVSGFDTFETSDPYELSTTVGVNYGYVDPDYFRTCRLTDKSDVFSFGMVLAELLLSKKPIFYDLPKEAEALAMHFLSSLQSNCLELMLDAQVLEEDGMAQLYQVAHLMSRCLSIRGEDRPTMKEVAMELEELSEPKNRECIKENPVEFGCSPIGLAHSSIDDASGSDSPFVTECEEIPSFRLSTLSSHSNPPPTSSSSNEKARSIAVDALGGWLPAITPEWRCDRMPRKENSDFLLQRLMCNLENVNVKTKLFTMEELEEATESFSESHILGRGGHSTVYLGILQNKKPVAIKRLRATDESQIEKFVNEVLIVSQVIHTNIVRLLGCCLETRVLLLVFEFVPSGTLFDHIHGVGDAFKLSWETRLRIATEVAAALAYLHSATSTRIIHGDVKSTNILLDENSTAKVSDFGCSRSIPFEQTHVMTPLIQGTIGYIDPECIRTYQLTEKSDVYSFGVILAELLLSEKPIVFDRPEEERSLALHFTLSLKRKCLEQILDAQILEEAKIEHLYQVAELARKCLSVKGDDRPTMKEVAAELEELRKPQSQVCLKENTKEVDCLAIGLAHSCADDAIGRLSQVRNEKAIRYISSKRKKKPVSFTQKFPTVDILTLRSLSRLLAIDSKNHPTAEEAPAHPYFCGPAKPDHPAAQPISLFDFYFDRRKLTAEDARELRFREVISVYHLEQRDLNFYSEDYFFMNPRKKGAGRSDLQEEMLAADEKLDGEVMSTPMVMHSASYKVEEKESPPSTLQASPIDAPAQPAIISDLVAQVILEIVAESSTLLATETLSSLTTESPAIPVAPPATIALQIPATSAHIPAAEVSVLSAASSFSSACVPLSVKFSHSTSSSQLTGMEISTDQIEALSMGSSWVVGSQSLGIDWPAMPPPRTRPVDALSIGMIESMQRLLQQCPLAPLSEAREDLQTLTRCYHEMGFPEEPWMAALTLLWSDLVHLHKKHWWETKVFPQIQSLEGTAERLDREATELSREAAEYEQLSKGVAVQVAEQMLLMAQLRKELDELSESLAWNQHLQGIWATVSEDSVRHRDQLLHQASVARKQAAQLRKNRPDEWADLF